MTSVSPLGTINVIGSPAVINATDGAHRKLVHGPRADIDPLQLVFGGHAALRPPP